MLKINPTPEAIKFHYDNVSKILDKIGNYSKTKNNKKHQLSKSVIDFIRNNKIDLIGAEPNILLEKHKKFENLNLDSEQQESTKVIFKYVYEKYFQNKHGKDFLNHLNIDTCTYCNRNYTLDFKNLNNSRAQLDHWFPKESFPILALSFYNLIPSCSSCNHIKGAAKEIKWLEALDNLVHPYCDRLDFTFSYEFDGFNKPKTWIKKYKQNLKTEKTIKSNKLREIYETQSGKELQDLYDLRMKYSKNYLDILCNKTFQGLSLSQEEAYRMIFGIEIEEENFHKRPFSKFKKDIIQELLKK